MALQTFTAGQVLTAAQVTALQANDFNQTVSTKVANYVLVAADKGTRVVMNSGSATTITVNSGLFNAGDTLTIQNIGAGVSTITAGTATVVSAGALAVTQNAGGVLFFTSASAAIYYPFAGASASALVLVKSQTIGTAVSTIVVNDAFSATFDNYLIKVNGGVGSNNLSFDLQLNGITTGVYNYGILRGTFSGSTPEYQGFSAQTVFNQAVTGSPQSLAGKFEIDSPFLNQQKTYRSYFSRFDTLQTQGTVHGFVNSTLSATGFTFTIFGQTATGGTIRVYGFGK